MKKSKKSFFLPILILPVFFSGTFASVFCKEQAPTPATLEFWGVFDDSSVYEGLIRKFNQSYPYITVNYHKKSQATYEKELVDALAAGRGPDIFMIQNNWLPKHGNKIYPADTRIFTVKEFGETFVDVAAQDFVVDGNVYAAPLAVDSLALFYNKDLLNSAGLANPPKTWEEFNSAVTKLTVKDDENNIIRAGAAIGTAKNINRSIDILMALMLQSGAKMTSSDNLTATFDQSVSLASGQSFKPGEEALVYYTNFAKPQKVVYTWNDYQHYSIDAFVEGKTAMMFNYSYQLPVIRSRAPHLNFGVAALPQISATSDKKVSYANYWGLTVSKTSPNSIYAWTFIKWLTLADNSKTYLEETKRPIARRDLVDWQKDDQDLGVFAQQSLLARSWWEADAAATETIFAQMINDVVSNVSSAQDAVTQASKQVTLLMAEYQRKRQAEQ